MLEVRSAYGYYGSATFVREATLEDRKTYTVDYHGW